MGILNFILKFSTYAILKGLIFILLILWITGFVIHSIFPESAIFTVLQPFTNFIYGNVCHQLPERSFILNDIHFLVCSRCSGIYFGAIPAFFIPISYLLKYDLKTLFGLAILAILIDVGIEYFGLIDFNLKRVFAVGLFLGFTATLNVLKIIYIEINKPKNEEEKNN
ncbi:MAG: DUF2085 domain-containing protein [Ignavibacteriaceae bacterium]|nr:DUF2085 domain-containing protein [Ignavibacteriaceae bacterium]